MIYCKRLGAVVLVGVVSFSSADIGLGDTYETYVGSSVTHYAYVEPGLMKDEGNVIGVEGGLSWFHNDQMYKVEGSILEGDVAYSSNGTGSTEEQYSILEGRALWGKQYHQKQFNFIPFIGLAYRYLDDQPMEVRTTTGHFTYEREQSYTYCPMGLELHHYAIQKDWLMDAVVEYDYFIEGLNHTHIPEGRSHIEGLFEQNSGFGCRASLVFSHQFGKNTYMIKPYAHYWHVDKSTSQFVWRDGSREITTFEPENTTTEMGLNIAMVW